jgi:hypothetical protein
MPPFAVLGFVISMGEDQEMTANEHAVKSDDAEPRTPDA